VDGITVGRGEGGETTVEVTYRFGPPDDTADMEGSVVGNVQNSSSESCTPYTNAPTLTVVAVK
jgi:hypothetical protein